MLGPALARARRPQQEVPRMRVRVIHAVDEDLLAIGFHAQTGGLLAVHAARVQGFDVAHAGARHPFGGEHTLGRELVDHARDDDVLAIGEVGGDSANRGGFVVIVEFGQHHLADLAVDGVPAPVRQNPAQQGEDAPDHAQVGLHDGLDARVLHLDRHLLARMQARHVHLANRRRSHRGPIEFTEHLARLATTEFRHQPGLDVLIGSRRHAILQGLAIPCERPRAACWPAR